MALQYNDHTRGPIQVSEVNNIITATTSTSNSVDSSTLSVSENFTDNRSKWMLIKSSNSELSQHACQDGKLHEPHSTVDNVHHDGYTHNLALLTFKHHQVMKVCIV